MEPAIAGGRGRDTDGVIAATRIGVAGMVSNGVLVAKIPGYLIADPQKRVRLARYDAPGADFQVPHQADIFKKMRSVAPNANDRIPIKPTRGISLAVCGNCSGAAGC